MVFFEVPGVICKYHGNDLVSALVYHGITIFFFFFVGLHFLLWLEDDCINQEVCVGLTIIQCQFLKKICKVSEFMSGVIYCLAYV